MGSQSPIRQGRGNTMRYQDLLLLVVSSTIASKAATEEKSIQKRSVETFLSRLSFNPFTPFPELLTTTTPSTPSSPSSLIRRTKQEKRKKKKFPVFVAVEYATTQRTILPTFVESERVGSTVKNAQSVKNGKEESKNRVINSVSGLSDKEWISSILRRTTTRRPPSQTPSKTLKVDARPRFKTNKVVDWSPAQHGVPEQVHSKEVPELVQNIPLDQNKKTSLSVQEYHSPQQAPDQHQHQQGHLNYSPLALRLFQPRQDLHQTVEQQQINHQQFLQKNRHRLFAQLSPTQSQQSQQSQQYQQSREYQQSKQYQQPQQFQQYQQFQQSPQYQVNDQGLDF